MCFLVQLRDPLNTLIITSILITITMANDNVFTYESFLKREVGIGAAFFKKGGKTAGKKGKRSTSPRKRLPKLSSPRALRSYPELLADAT